MEKLIGDYLSGLELRNIQTCKNLSVVPLFNTLNGGPLYHTLKEAMEQGTLTISEVNSGGSVPELRVMNKGDIPVLLLDGEELAGAKQNRVLNTTILIDAHSETVIPVACTEQGRWAYTSNHFADSGFVMASNVRREKVRSVAENLRTSARYDSDQREVWDNIHTMAAEAGVHSATGAMKDVFTAKESDLDDYLAAVRLRARAKRGHVLHQRLHCRPRLLFTRLGLHRPPSEAYEKLRDGSGPGPEEETERCLCRGSQSFP